MTARQLAPSSAWSRAPVRGTTTAEAAVERYAFLQHAGKQILLADYSNLNKAPETLAHMRRVQDVIERQPRRSIRYLLDVTNLHFDGQVLGAFRDYAPQAEPYFLASAVVGLSGLQLAAYRMITRLAGIDMPAFTTRPEAMDYLARKG